MNYECPVCGFNKLKQPAERHMICPCCGTQFGYHDKGASSTELRHNWITKGAQWHSKRTAVPVDWSAYQQLVAFGVKLTHEEEDLLISYRVTVIS
jgi:uncharacterized Zn finger protein (UPF0148 family)